MIARYIVFVDPDVYGGYDMDLSNDGDCVFYTDHIKVVDKLEKKIAELEARVDSLKNNIF